MPILAADIRSLCRAFTKETVQIVAGIARSKRTLPSVRIMAIGMLWDRGWGKPTQQVTANGETDIRITIRNIIEEANGHGGTGSEPIDVTPVADAEQQLQLEAEPVEQPERPGDDVARGERNAARKRRRAARAGKLQPKRRKPRGQA